VSRRERSTLTVGGLGPPTGSRAPTYHPDPPVWREPASCLGLVRSRQVSAGTGAARGFHWKTRPPTALNVGGLSALCRSRARGNFCQTTLLVACYQGAQCSRRRRARNAHQPAAPVGYDDSAPPIMMPTLHLRGRPAVYAATYSAATGATMTGQGDSSPRPQSPQCNAAYPGERSSAIVAP